MDQELVLHTSRGEGSFLFGYFLVWGHGNGIWYLLLLECMACIIFLGFRLKKKKSVWSVIASMTNMTVCMLMLNCIYEMLYALDRSVNSTHIVYGVEC